MLQSCRDCDCRKRNEKKKGERQSCYSVPWSPHLAHSIFCFRWWWSTVNVKLTLCLFLLLTTLFQIRYDCTAHYRQAVPQIITFQFYGVYWKHHKHYNRRLSDLNADRTAIPAFILCKLVMFLFLWVWNTDFETSPAQWVTVLYLQLESISSPNNQTLTLFINLVDMVPEVYQVKPMIHSAICHTLI